MNKAEWEASYLEQQQRSAFYKATNLVNSYINEGYFVKLDETFRTGKGKADIINFLTDGSISLPDRWAQGLSSKEIRSTAEYTLSVMHVGMQIAKDQNISIQKSVSENYSKIKEIYQRNGGEKVY
jgi:hypothetical protein